MLSNSLPIAKQFDKKPILLAVGDREKIYYVKDGSHPAIVTDKNPLDLLSQRELFRLKQKYKVSHKVFKRIERCYEKTNKKIDLNGCNTINNRLLIDDIENLLLEKLKREYKHKGSDFLPYYDPQLTSKIALHTAIVGSSGAGKTYLACEILLQNFSEHKIFVFSPTASTDPAYKKLQDHMSKKRVKLINSNEIDIPLEEDMLSPFGCVCVFDDLESTTQPARKFISDLQSTLLYRGRHLLNKSTGAAVTVISIIHDAFNSNITKASSIEASRVILFPNTNRSNATKYLKNRLHKTSKEIKSIYEFAQNSRWIFLSTHHPSILLTSDNVKLI